MANRQESNRRYRVEEVMEQVRSKLGQVTAPAYNASG
jgi:hypothetical protein